MRFGRRAIGAATVLLVAVVAGPVSGAGAAAPVVSTLAGGPGAGPGLAVGMQPTSLAVSGSTLYIADSVQNGNSPDYAYGSHSVVRAMDLATGNTTVLAGTGVVDYGLANGPAAAAELPLPTGLAIGPAGRLYLAELATSTVRRIDPDGTITTIGGTGLRADTPDGVPAASNPLYLISFPDVDLPFGMTVDGAGNVYVPEPAFARIRRIGADGILTTLASGSLLNSVTSVVGMGDGTFVARTPSNIVRISADGSMTALYTPEPGRQTGAAIARSPLGVYLFGDTSVGLVEVSATGQVVTLADNLTLHSLFLTPGLSEPRYHAVAVDATGNVYLGASTGIARRAPDGTLTRIGGFLTRPSFSGDGRAATTAQIGSVSGIADLPGGALVLTDAGSNRVRRIDATGKITTIAGNNSANFAGDGGPAAAATFYAPASAGTDVFGNLYLVDMGHARIRKIDTAGSVSTVGGNGGQGDADRNDGRRAVEVNIGHVGDVAADAHGNVYFTDSLTKRVRKIDRHGIVSTVAGDPLGATGDGGRATQARLNFPDGLAVDGRNNLYVVDTFDHKVRKIDSSGIISTIAGNGTRGYSGDGLPGALAALDSPTDVAVDGAGNVYLTDYGNNRIRRVDPAGVIETLVGGPGYDWAGDGGPLNGVKVAAPADLTVTRSGALVWTEFLSGRIRQITGLAVPPGLAVPAEPESVAAAGIDGGVTATWTQPFDAPTSAIDSYAALLFDGAGNFTGKSATVCAGCPKATTFTGLSNGQSYVVAVAAHNGTGWGPPLLAVSVVAGTPGVPSVTAVSGPGAGSVTVAWKPPAANGSAVDGYAVLVFDGNGFTGRAAVVDGAARSATVTGLTSGRGYVAVVVARNAFGWGYPAFAGVAAA